MSSSNEEEPTLEEVLSAVFAELEELKAGYLEMREAYVELWLEHKAMLHTIAATGALNKEIFQNSHAELVKGMTTVEER